MTFHRAIDEVFDEFEYEGTSRDLANAIIKVLESLPISYFNCSNNGHIHLVGTGITEEVRDEAIEYIRKKGSV
jgi:hypothetical protein